MDVIAAIIFVIIAVGSMIMNAYLSKYPKDFVFHTVLKSILFFNGFFFLISIPILFGTPIGYLLFVIPICFLVSVITSFTSRFLAQAIDKKLGKTE